MAFPQVVAVNGGYDTADQTEHTVNLPSGIQAGDLLLVFFASDGGWITITFPEGWQKLFQETHLEIMEFAAGYKIAEGTEGATIIVTTSSAQMTAHTSYRITDYSGTPEVGTATTGASTTPDPPNLSPSWGTKDTLWFAACGADRTAKASAYPTNYSSGRSDGGYVTGGASVGTARRELNADSEDPSTFTISASEQWVANTVAIQPAAVLGWQGIVMGVTNPAKIMGVDVANIAKVHGVA